MSYKSINRESARKQGFYDGRFRRRVVADKKKKRLRVLCRKKVDPNKVDN